MDLQPFARSWNRASTARWRRAAWLAACLIVLLSLLVIATKHPTTSVTRAQSAATSLLDSMAFTVWCVDDEPFGSSLKMAHILGRQGNKSVEGMKALVQIDNSESINEFAVSPNQNFVLVAANPSAQIRTNLSQLWTVHVGGKRRVIRADMAGYANLRWSTSSSLICYISNEGISQGSGDTNVPFPENLYIHSLTTNKRIRVMRDANSAEWIPRAAVLASTSPTKTGIQLSTFNGRRSTIESATQGGSLVVSQDGRLLLVIKDIYLGEYKLTENAAPEKANSWTLAYEYSIPWEPELAAFSPDGRLVALSVPAFGSPITEPRQLAILDTAKGMAKLVGTIPPPIHRLKWSNDGHHLLYTSYSHTEPADVPSFKLLALSVTNGNWMRAGEMDWATPSTAKPIQILRFPTNAEQVEWIEEK